MSKSQKRYRCITWWEFLIHCNFWLQIQRSRVRFPALPDFLSSSGSGTGSIQPREVSWGAAWIKSSGSGPENRLTAVGIRCADHVTPLYPQKLALTSPTGGGRSVGIVRSRTKATEFVIQFCTILMWVLYDWPGGDQIRPKDVATIHCITYVISYITYVGRVWPYSNLSLMQLTHCDDKPKSASLCLLGFDKDDLTSPTPCLPTHLRTSCIRLAYARLYVCQYVEIKYVPVSGTEELRKRQKIKPGLVFWNSTASILPSLLFR